MNNIIHRSEGADQVAGRAFHTFDLGFVRLVDYMGTDASIVQAARVSYGEGTKGIRTDKGLIAYLMKNRHTSPFEMVELKFHVKLPIYLARQIIRHRTASVNEYSARYSILPEEFHAFSCEELRVQDTKNRQATFDKLEYSQLTDENKEVLRRWVRSQEDAFDLYSALLDMGVSREQARVGLPLSTYTQWYWKVDLHNFLHYCNLRLDSHAQAEVRAIVAVQYELVKQFIAPWTCEAWEEWVLNAPKPLGFEDGIVIKHALRYWLDQCLVHDVPEDQRPHKDAKRLWEMLDKIKPYEGIKLREVLVTGPEEG